jgi:large subunit ribosomal protein L9
MQVILKEDVDHLGEMGDTVKVAMGYARNYLLPRGLAVQSDSASAKQIEHELSIIKRRDAKRREVMNKQAKQLESITLEFKVRAGEGDKLFGAVTSGHIAEKLGEVGHDINRKAIQLKEPIKALGIYTVPVKFASGIEAGVKVWVTGLEDEITTVVTPAETTEEAPAEASE